MAKRRNRGDGSLHLRKDGRWEGRIVVGYDENGLPNLPFSASTIVLLNPTPGADFIFSSFVP